MLRSWMVVTFLVSMVTPSLSQSGDGEWGSGETYVNQSHSSESEPKDAPEESTQSVEADPKQCSSRFYTCPASARRLRALREEINYLQAIQHGNQAVMENLIQYVSAEIGEQSYQEVIQENVAGIKEDHFNCEGVVKKVVEDLETKLEGGLLELMAGKQKIKEESLAFESLLRTITSTVQKLESSSKTLYSSFTKQLKKPLVSHQ